MKRQRRGLVGNPFGRHGRANPGKRDSEIEHDVKYCVTSVGVSTNLMKKAVRRHLSVESFHCDPDMTFREDACDIGEGKAPEGLSGMRKPAFNFLAPRGTGARRVSKDASSCSRQTRHRGCLKKSSTRSSRRINGEYSTIGKNRAKCLRIW